METEKKNFLSRINFNNVFKKLLFLMPFGILGMFVFSYYTVKQDIRLLVNEFSYFYLLLSFVLCFVPWLTHTIRMAIWNRFLGLRIPVQELFKISLGTELGAAITPSAVGGGPVKAGMLVQQDVPIATSLFLTVLGSAEDWIFFLFVVPFSFVMLKAEVLPNFTLIILKFLHSPGFQVFLLIILILLILRLLKPSVLRNLTQLLKRISFLHNFLTKLEKLIFDMEQVFQVIAHKGKRFFALSLVFTSIQWLSRYSIIFLLLRGLGYHYNPFELFLLQVIVYVMMSFIPTPGSAIGAEASFYYIFQSVIPGDLIGFITTGWRLLTYYFPISVASVIFLIVNYRMVLKAKRAEIGPLESPALKSEIQLT